MIGQLVLSWIQRVDCLRCIGGDKPCFEWIGACVKGCRFQCRSCNIWHLYTEIANLYEQLVVPFHFIFGYFLRRLLT